MLKNFSAIDTNRLEGRFLIAAVEIIRAESIKDQTPEEVMAHCATLVNYIFKDAPLPAPEPPLSFVRELEKLLNKHGFDSGLRMPDFVLASFIFNILTGIAKMQTEAKSLMSSSIDCKNQEPIPSFAKGGII